MSRFSLQVVDAMHNDHNFRQAEVPLGEPYTIGVFAEIEFHIADEYMQTGHNNCGQMPISGAVIHNFNSKRIDMNKMHSKSIELAAHNLEMLGVEVLRALQHLAPFKLNASGVIISGKSDTDLLCKIDLTNNSSAQASLLTVSNYEALLKSGKIQKQCKESANKPSGLDDYDDGFGTIQHTA